MISTKKYMPFLIIILSALFFLVNADASIYTSRDNFNTALDIRLASDPSLNKQTQGWDDPDLTGDVVGGLFGTKIDDVTYQNLTVSLFGLPSFKRLVVAEYDSFDPSPIPVSSPNALSRIGTLALIDILTLTFDNPVMAFGISFIPLATETSWILALGYDNDPFISMLDLDYNMYTEFFVGMILDVPVKTVVMIVTTPTVYMYDDMVYASQIPIPGAGILLFSGIIGILALKRKK